MPTQDFNFLFLYLLLSPKTIDLFVLVRLKNAGLDSSQISPSELVFLAVAVVL